MSIRFYSFVCLYFCFFVSTAHAQEGVPTHAVDGKYIKEWLVLGPFFPNDLERDFRVPISNRGAFKPEKNNA